MTDQDKLQYAKARLGLACMMGDTAEADKWAEHVAYWEAQCLTDSTPPNEDEDV